MGRPCCADWGAWGAWGVWRAWGAWGAWAERECGWGRCSTRVVWGDEAVELWEPFLVGCGADVLRSELVLSEEPAPGLLHRGVFWGLGRRVFLPCFWGVVSPRRSSAGGSSVGIESREEEEEVRSDGDAVVVVVVSEPWDALACGWCCADGLEGGGSVSARWGAALFVSGWAALEGAPGSMSIDGPARSWWHRDAGGR